MKIEVHLYGKFREEAGTSLARPDIPEGRTVAELYPFLGLKEEVYRMALVNGIRVQDEHVLREGDEVHLFQPVGGG